MATTGQISINEIDVLEVTSDPRVTSTPAPLGSLAILKTTAEVFKKFGAGNTDWKLLSYFESFQSSNTNNITTTSTSDILITNMTLTPSRGKWLIFFQGQTHGSLNSVNVFFSIYTNGVKETNSEIFYIRSSSSGRNYVGISGIPVIVDGTQAVEVRWRVSNGTGYLYGRRTMTAIRAG